MFSAIAVLLGCFPLFNALRSCGSKLFATVLLAPLIAFSLIQIVQGSRDAAGSVNFSSLDIFFCSVYFRPEAVLENFAGPSFFLYFSQPPLIASIAEAVKWCLVLAIAAIGGTIGTSPTPRAPNGWRGFGTSTSTASIIGTSEATGTR